MSGVLDLVRGDLRDFVGYRSARSDRLDGDAWLNANESPWPNASDSEARLRRYPDPQPAALRERLATLFGCDPSGLLAGRGSDEAIDLLVRAVCEPGQGAIVTTSPTFGMYAVSARLHGVRVVDVPLRDGADGFTCDLDAVADAVRANGARLVFLCSPGNPPGNLLDPEAVDALAARLDRHALVVVDEAYQDYAGSPSLAARAGQRTNLVVLRTLSKAHALASARIGAVIGDRGLIDVLRRCQAPYPLPASCVAQALAALSPASLDATWANVATVVQERERLADALRGLPGVRRVYPSSANFLLVRFEDPQATFNGLLDAGIVVRDMRAQPQLADGLRITIGRPDQNDRLLSVLANLPVTA